MVSAQQLLAGLGLTLIERGWLSSNNIVFAATAGAPATIVDTGYGAHAEQTVALVRSEMDDSPLQRIVSTHLHSDHCGGNAELARVFGAEVWVPEASFDLARRWDEAALSFDETGQRCDRFEVFGAVCPGSTLRLGNAAWQVVAAAGHDPDAVMLFEPTSRVLITADALWEDRVAIVFPEIDGKPGFEAARATLDVIEALQPELVIPGHGPAFTHVGRALQGSRARLAQFERQPERHFRYATRALTMFHMLEVRRVARSDLISWLRDTPIFARLHANWNAGQQSISEFAEAMLAQLLADGLLARDSTGEIVIP